MGGDGWVDEIATEAPQARECALLVRPGQPAVTDNVGDQDRGELPESRSFDPPAGGQRNTISGPKLPINKTRANLAQLRALRLSMPSDGDMPQSCAQNLRVALSDAARSVVIGVGGFLGMGTKDVAVPFGALQWRTESRNVPTEPASTVANTATGEAAKPQTRKIDPAAEEASQGYPDKAMLNMTVAQLKAAPDFKYAPDPAAQTESASQGLEQRSHAQTSVPKP